MSEYKRKYSGKTTAEKLQVIREADKEEMQRRNNTSI
jgi:hypothetical protein